MELNDEIYEQIVKLCEDADQLLEENQFEESIQKYADALDLVPNPKRNWEASTFIYTSMGDAYFIWERYEQAKDCFNHALNCPDGIANPLILLRLGQCLFQCGKETMAKEYLLRAYMLEGEELFSDEDETYLKLIENLI